jgi:putative DNA primase/helicase
MTITPFPAPEPVTAADLSPEFSDDALALEFSRRHAGELRYVAQWGAWLRWTGTRWEFEKTLKTFDLARAVAREFANAANDPDDGPKIASASKVAAIERLARSDRRHAATVEIWDADPWLLNTPGGVINLRTGGIMQHDPARYMTKITSVAPDGQCPRWHQFLAEITGNNKDLQAFLQRIAGYALTGSTQEHALFFFYGTGGNGKGVFLNTLSAILADYAAVAPMETFIATQGERHPTDLAGLRGARLVTSQETEEGRRWAESKIKALTGGDPISARFMRQDFFTYLPAFKLVIGGNHKPGLRGVDEAIRRRFNLVPFIVTITNPDKGLPEKLRAEWPGILQWAVAGCLEWQRQGLNPPQIVREATEAYLGDEDALARWIEECCVTGNANLSCTSSKLWQSWKAWAETNNERVGSQTMFGSALDGHGFMRSRTEAARGYQGLDLKLTEPKNAGHRYYDLNDAGPQWSADHIIETEIATETQDRNGFNDEK